MRPPIPPLCLLLLFATTPALAQLRRPDQAGRPADTRRPPPAVSVLGGPAPYDDGIETGTGTAGGVWFEFPTSRALLIEPGIGFFRYRTEAGERISYILPEIGLQLQAPLPVFRPYVGAGLGFSEFLDGRGKSFLTLHAAGGVRIALAGGWGLRAEARARTIDPFALDAVGLGVGVSHTLGRSR